MKAMIAAIVLFAFAGSCIMIGSLDTKREESKRVLQQQGIEVTRINHAWFGCGQEDSFNFAFEGTNTQGIPVRGNVCSGYFKGSTVRFK